MLWNMHARIAWKRENDDSGPRPHGPEHDRIRALSGQASERRQCGRNTLAFVVADHEVCRRPVWRLSIEVARAEAVAGEVRRGQSVRNLTDHGVANSGIRERCD